MTETTVKTDAEKRTEAIAAKIRNIFALAQDERDNGNEERFLNYWAKAQELITKHAIDEQLLRVASTDKKERQEPVNKRLYLKDGPFLKSRCLLASRIGSAMGLATRLANNGLYVVYVGYPEDVELAWQMFELVEPQMVEFGDRRIRIKEHTRIVDLSTASGHVSARAYRISYYEGFSQKVQTRLWVSRNDAAEQMVIAEGVGEQRTGRVTGALVLRDKQAIVKAAEEKFYPPKVSEKTGKPLKPTYWKVPQTRSRAAEEATYAGSEDGAKARLTPNELASRKAIR